MKSAAMGVCLAGFVAGETYATSLQVAPVSLDLTGPTNTATITLRNLDVEPITSQLRVFRWTQRDGADHLEPASDVVASPPVVQLRSRQDYTVRIVRLAGQPVAGEEAYRLVIDELPKPNRSAGSVALVVRHVVPVFFRANAASPPSVAWSLSRHGRTVTLNAVNAGERRARFAAVTVRDASGKVVSETKGLLGYSLGRSARRWTLPSSPSAQAGARYTISGLTDIGSFNAPLPVSSGR